MDSAVKRLLISIIVALSVLLIVLTILPIDVIDIKQPVGSPYPRALPTDGRHFGSPHLKGKVITQTFKPEADNISGIGVFFSKKTNKPKTGLINLNLKVKKGAVLENMQKATERADLIRVPSIYTVYFQPEKVIRGRTYAIVVDGSGLDSGITPFASLYDAYKGGAAFLNDKKSSRDIVFQTYYRTNLPAYFSKGTGLSPLLLTLMILAFVLGAAVLIFNYEVLVKAYPAKD